MTRLSGTITESATRNEVCAFNDVLFRGFLFSRGLSAFASNCSLFHPSFIRVYALCPLRLFPLVATSCLHAIFHMSCPIVAVRCSLAYKYI